MQIFNLDSIKTFPYEKRDRNVFFETKEFKTRMINLSPGEKIPECEMASYVIFIVIEGKSEIKVNGKKTVLEPNQCLITEPSLISIKTASGARLIGIQINKN